MTLFASGIKLLDICKSSNLRIVNCRIGDESGRYTFIANTGKSVIDYAIVSCTLFPIIENLTVHTYFLVQPMGRYWLRLI